MNILLTNDDGLHAPGIRALFEALVEDSPHTVVPIAPLTVQSATSHGVTFHEPLMTRVESLGWNGAAGKTGVTGIAVDGRPADCVKLAVSQLWPERFGPGTRPDLLISGMNAGANVGINVIYSGTVAAALEAAFLGIPAIAVSLHLGRSSAGSTPDFAKAARHGRRAIDAIIAKGLPEKHACLSVNIPVTNLGDDPRTTERYPLRVCPMNTHGLNDKYEKRESPSGETYYWAAGYGLDFRSTDAGSDVQHLLNRAITVTPLLYDLTSHGTLKHWIDRLE